MRIDLLPFAQLAPHTCVAACVRIVLAATGARFSEEELAAACHTDPSGATLADATGAVRRLGFDALFIRDASREVMIEWLQHGVPVIVGLSAAVLTPDATGGHAVVVCGISDDDVILVDPALGAERRMSQETFLRAWNRRGNRALVIWRRASETEGE